jgi:DNA-binding NtrC family response regulator
MMDTDLHARLEVRNAAETMLEHLKPIATFASHMMMRGAGVGDLKDILGHADVKMTMRYAHLSPAHKRTAVARLDGLTRPVDVAVDEPAGARRADAPTRGRIAPRLSADLGRGRTGRRGGGGLSMAQRDVLIVEHDLEVRDVLRQILDAAGYTCQLADDGHEGLEAFKAGRPPLVVTDLKMPDMTGIELLRQARAVDGDVAVIVLSGAADVKNAIESLKLGAHAFLMKPINIDELLITVERALERRQLLIERRQHQEPYGQPQETDRTTLGRADLAQRDVLILVVEEDRQVREVLRQIFDLAGYKCLLTGDGKEGLKAFRESRPSLVIADLGMPMMVRVGKWVHGVWVRDARIGLLMEIWLEDPDAAVIVSTSGFDAKIVIELLKLGAHASLMKPINIDELLITVERALERRQLLIERRRHPGQTSAAEV